MAQSLQSNGTAQPVPENARSADTLGLNPCGVNRPTDSGEAGACRNACLCQNFLLMLSEADGLQRHPIDREAPRDLLLPFTQRGAEYALEVSRNSERRVVDELDPGQLQRAVAHAIGTPQRFEVTDVGHLPVIQQLQVIAQVELEGKRSIPGREPYSRLH